MTNRRQSKSKQEFPIQRTVICLTIVPNAESFQRLLTELDNE